MRPVAIVLGAILAATAQNATAQLYPVEILARDGHPYASLPSGSQIDGISSHMYIASDGTVVFRAWVVGGGTDYNAEIVSTPEGPRVLAHTHAIFPGTTNPISSFQNGWSLPLPGGRVAVVAETIGDYRGACGIAGPQGLTPIAVGGQTLPGFSEGVLGWVPHLSMKGDALAFIGNLYSNPTTVSGRGLWAGSPQQFALVAGSNQPMPGFPPGARITGLAEAPAINRHGQVLFLGYIDGATGLWSAHAQALTLIARTHQEFPGTGHQFTLLMRPRLNDRGDLMFLGSLSGQSTPSRLGIWRMFQGLPEPIAVRGDHAPGTDANFDHVGRGMWPDMILTESGRVAFWSSLTAGGATPDNNVGIWEGLPGQFRLAARTGQQVPGQPAGVTFYGFDKFAANSSGYIVFYARFRAPGGPISRGVFFSDPRGAIHPIALDNGAVLVGGVPLAIQTVLLTQIINSGPDGTPTILNDAGSLVMYLQLAGPGNINAVARATLPPFCWVNCDASSSAPILNVADFTCFLGRFAAGDPVANCDQSVTQPALNLADFLCFMQRFAEGCP